MFCYRYNLTHIGEVFSKFPSYLIAGKEDCLISKYDLIKLENILKPSGAIFERIDRYAHLDYDKFE